MRISVGFSNWLLLATVVNASSSSSSSTSSSSFYNSNRYDNNFYHHEWIRSNSVKRKQHHPISVVYTKLRKKQLKSSSSAFQLTKKLTRTNTMIDGTLIQQNHQSQQSHYRRNRCRNKLLFRKYNDIDNHHGHSGIQTTLLFSHMIGQNLIKSSILKKTSDDRNNNNFCSGKPRHYSKYRQHQMNLMTLLLSSKLINDIENDQTDTTTPPPTTTKEQPLLLKLYNSKTRQKELFTKKFTEEVSMYTCGPTVYDYAHIGNFRAFLTYDLLKRVLLYLGYTNVLHICNITDVDDKIIKKANQLQLPIGKMYEHITLFYENEFLYDLSLLNCIPASYYPRATVHINDIIYFIYQLYTVGLAYETIDGSWYFNTQLQMNKYGQQLIQLNFNNMKEQKIDGIENLDNKKHFADFALWKAYKPTIDRNDCIWEMTNINDIRQLIKIKDKENKMKDNTNKNIQMNENETNDDDNNNINSNNLQNFRIQKGRPGWHIECSAMVYSYFGIGNTIDFHGGGIDLKFPHHENEIAQSEGLYNLQYYKNSNNKKLNNKNTISSMAPLTSISSSTTTSPEITMKAIDNDNDNSDNNDNTKYVSYCNCWFHNGFVNIGNNNEKMSKSLNNFITLREGCNNNALDIRAYRYLILSSHYRTSLNYNQDVIKASKNAIIRIDKIKNILEQALLQHKEQQHQDTSHNDINQQPVASTKSMLATVIVPEALQNFNNAIVDDLMMPRAAAAMFAIIKACENEWKRYQQVQQSKDKEQDQEILSQEENKILDYYGIEVALDALKQMDQVFGIFYDIPMPLRKQKSTNDTYTPENMAVTETDSNIVNTMINNHDDDSLEQQVPDSIWDLINERIKAKDAKDYQLADSIRQDIGKMGYEIKDVKNGSPIVTKILL